MVTLVRLEVAAELMQIPAPFFPIVLPLIYRPENPRFA
jgi:hypothetical protein